MAFNVVELSVLQRKMLEDTPSLLFGRPLPRVLRHFNNCASLASFVSSARSFRSSACVCVCVCVLAHHHHTTHTGSVLRLADNMTSLYVTIRMSHYIHVLVLAHVCMCMCVVGDKKFPCAWNLTAVLAALVVESKEVTVGFCMGVSHG